MIFQKKAAIEMSVSTIVVIVLAMTMLILGLTLVRTIFSGAITSVEQVDQAVKGKINELFSEDKTKKVVIYPKTQLIEIEKGNSQELGFAFSIRNVDVISSKFSYTVSVNDPNIAKNCRISSAEAQKWIVAGGEGTITIGPGSVMEQPEFVRFIIPETAPPCLVRYGLDIKKDSELYGSTVNVDVKVVSD